MLLSCCNQMRILVQVIVSDEKVSLAAVEKQALDVRAQYTL